jgi:anti-sigma-K factor RskA
MSTPIDRIDDSLPPSDDVYAGEYVLGVLDPKARMQAQSRIASDPNFADLVEQWEQRFSAWMTRADPVAPSSHVWPRIRTELGWTAVASTPKGRRGSERGCDRFWLARTDTCCAAAHASGGATPTAAANSHANRRNWCEACNRVDRRRW